MNKEIMQSILDKIKEYNRIIIFRHKRPDGDAVGSTKGLAEILRISFPEKEIHIINSDYADYVSFLGGEDSDIDEALYAEALGIVIDTGTTDRISNKKFDKCREIIKIDHHIDNNPYGDISWVEEERSSACEMIAHFYDTFRDELKINSAAATYIYTGMVTDSGRFRFSSVSGDTMRLAGMLLDVGIDTDTLFANLYLKEFNSLKFQGYVYKKMKITDEGVIYLHITKKIKKKFNLTNEEASTAVGFMDSIRGCPIWIAFIDGDDSIRVRLRSRFVKISDVAEKYRGGGHACAAGSTLYSKKEIKALLADADATLRKFKESGEAWL